MKNKGRRHKSKNKTWHGSGNLKSTIFHLTRPIKSMSKGRAQGRFDKKKWQKRVRGYFKTNHWLEIE